jgi:formyl-CoA transferase
MVLNRNKRGIAVNLKTPGGLEVVKKLLADADVVTENYRKGTLEKLGLGYDVLQELNPRLVYCAISGYGRTGTLRRQAGLRPHPAGSSRDHERDRRAGTPAGEVGTSIADINAASSPPLGICRGRSRRASARARARWSRPPHGSGRAADCTGRRDPLRDRRRLGADRDPRTSSPRPTRRSDRDGWINIGARTSRTGSASRAPSAARSSSRMRASAPTATA